MAHGRGGRRVKRAGGNTGLEGLCRPDLERLYQRLYAVYGPQHWWPARTSFEVMVGAVLTQHTHWRGAARAVAALRGVRCLTPRTLLALDRDSLHALLRPAGCYRVKAERLHALCQWLSQQGGCTVLRRQPTARLRASLSSVRGVGPETADTILLYAFDRPVFVVDTYARRLFTRLGWIDPAVPGIRLRAAVQELLPPDTALFNELHALIVRHGKETCLHVPECRHCVVENDQRLGRAA